MGLGPARSCGPRCLGRSRAACAWACLGRHRLPRVRNFVHFREHAVIFVIVLGQQWRYLPQFFRSLLEHLDLFAKLGVFRLLLAQDLMDVFHTTPCWHSKEVMRDGSTVIPTLRLPG